MVNKIKVAVIGYGHLGKWHCQKVEVFKDIVDFVAIVENNPFAQQEAKKNHPDVFITNDISSLLPNLDAVFVVTPTSTHYELTRFFLDHHIHVFCEKPLCTTGVEGKELAKIVEKKNLILQVGHSERFHQCWEDLKQVFSSLKKPYSIRINRIAPFKGRATDVDVVQDLAIHDIDLLRYLFPSKIKSIKAQGYKIRTSHWDHVSIQVELDSHCEAHVVVGRNAVLEKRDWEITSEEGMIFIDLLHRQFFIADNNTQEGQDFVQTHHYEKRDHLLLEHQAFYEAIRDQNSPVVNVYDGLEAVELVDCVLKSLETNEKIWVKEIE